MNDSYARTAGEERLDRFCDVLETSDVAVFGITDYFSADSFVAFQNRFRQKFPQSSKRFLFNLELRLNEAVNQEVEEVNIHLVFHPEALDRIANFLRNLQIVKTGANEVPIVCADLSSTDDFASATVTRTSITEAFENTFGRKAIRQDHFLVIAAANNDGLRPGRGKRRKEFICDEIDKFADAFFGGPQNVTHYLRTDRFEDKSQVAIPKPVFCCSDAHSFQDLNKAEGNTTERDGENASDEASLSRFTWIKADPTYDGLRQTIYEPAPGDRVAISFVKPDQKAGYKVIRRIRFDDGANFPDEVEFGENLTSIIGSRSSGKSALLAYVAHSIDPELVESLTDGPGEGDDYHWSKLDATWTVEWGNGQSNESSPGRVVYIPQNYLYAASANPKLIKEKIQPVLFRLLPSFESMYRKTTDTVSNLNGQIADLVDAWFDVVRDIAESTTALRAVGDKGAIEGARAATELEIATLRDETRISEDDVKLYSKVQAQLASADAAIADIERQLADIADRSQGEGFFSEASFSLFPSATMLSPELRLGIEAAIREIELAGLVAINKIVTGYQTKLSKEVARLASSNKKALEVHSDLLARSMKNAALSELVRRLTEQDGLLAQLSARQSQLSLHEKHRAAIEKQLEDALLSRASAIAELASKLETEDQSGIESIRFGVECGIDEEGLQRLSEGLNLRDKTRFVEDHSVSLDAIRASAAQFLADLQSGKQKIVTRSTKEAVAKLALQLTEQILFVAKMEGDRIGGVGESTMTAGKRALFALRLILAESDDSWPLLIDQPEDDLDSRSIYEVVVPFVREKKKDRQIIMVSHNANMVIGADSEQVIVANRSGDDRKNSDGRQFNYLTGSLEDSSQPDSRELDTLHSQGIREHACAILDGGRAAFENRRNKYNIR